MDCQPTDISSQSEFGRDGLFRWSLSGADNVNRLPLTHSIPTVENPCRVLSVWHGAVRTRLLVVRSLKSNFHASRATSLFRSATAQARPSKLPPASRGDLLLARYRSGHHAPIASDSTRGSSDLRHFSGQFADDNGSFLTSL
jgi:hypothetical protein